MTCLQMKPNHPPYKASYGPGWEWFGIHEQPCKHTTYADIYDAADIQMRAREIKRKLKYKYLRYNYLQVYLAPRMHLHVRYTWDTSLSLKVLGCRKTQEQLLSKMFRASTCVSVSNGLT